MADLQHLIQYHEKKLIEARRSNNAAAINHHLQALSFLKRHQVNPEKEKK